MTLDCRFRDLKSIMVDLKTIQRLQEDPWAASTAVGLLLATQEAPGMDEFRASSVSRIAQVCDANDIALVALEGDSVQTLAQHGKPFSVPRELLAEALDRDEAVQADGFVAAPVDGRAARAEVLVVRNGGERRRIAALAAAVAVGMEVFRSQGHREHRIQRLEAILAAMQTWGRTKQVAALLVQMAEASTRLLDAERATIFLWDEANRQLIGRPALGVEGDELRIADNTGVVGQVLKTGQVRRVDMDQAAEIDRSTESQTQFHARNLMCVPLRNGEGARWGVFEVLNKRQGNFTPRDEEALVELATHAAIALENTQEFEELVQAHRQLVDQQAEGVRLVGDSPAIEALRATVRRVADTELAVLILGENGTGKEVVGQSIHYLSQRRDQPCIAVNCAALAETLLESELFGHEKGAFTDAREARPGKFELASGGTLFLDEIADLSPSGQAKLLRVLEEKVVIRVGGSTPIHTDARVIAATNQDLVALVREKKFREDLYYRLNVVTLELPPLRQRGEDILLLADHFLKQFSAQAGRRPPKFTAAARKRLLAHRWPGNVRELRNLVERLVYLSGGDKIEADELAFILSPGDESVPLFDSGLDLAAATKRFQAEYIRAAIDRSRGNMSQAASELGLHRSNLYRKMRQLEMPTSEQE